MPSGIGSWRRRENSGRLVGSRPDEDRRSRVSGQPAIEEVAAAESCGFVNSTPLTGFWGEVQLSAMGVMRTVTDSAFPAIRTISR
jgi:hypothetical protein